MFVFFSRHGGSVANAYKYPAYSEAAVIVIDVERGIMGFEAISRVASNKITHSGVVASCCGGEYRPIFDSRFGVAKTHAAREALRDRLYNSPRTLTPTI